MQDEIHGTKLDDYKHDPQYERRVVVFYDVLGWRDQIAKAGTDRKKIGDLRRLILQLVRTLQLRTNWNISASTFSDNIVISQPVCKHTPALIGHLAIAQIASAINGFLLRGGITIGEIVHDDEAVFGPALNRAYELESKIAHFPRIVLDKNVLAEIGDLGELPVEEDGVVFLDPFRLEFIQFIKNGEQAATREQVLEAGLPYPQGKSIKSIWNDDVLKIILEQLKPSMRTEPLSDDAWNKLAWLYDRIATQLGVPLANAFPRFQAKQ